MFTYLYVKVITMESFHGNYEHLHDLLNSIMHPLFCTGANQGFYLITVEIIVTRKKQY